VFQVNPHLRGLIAEFQGLDGYRKITTINLFMGSSKLSSLGLTEALQVNPHLRGLIAEFQGLDGYRNITTINLFMGSSKLSSLSLTEAPLMSLI